MQTPVPPTSPETEAEALRRRLYEVEQENERLRQEREEASRREAERQRLEDRQRVRAAQEPYGPPSMPQGITAPAVDKRPTREDVVRRAEAEAERIRREARQGLAYATAPDHTTPGAPDARTQGMSVTVQEEVTARRRREEMEHEMAEMHRLKA